MSRLLIFFAAALALAIPPVAFAAEPEAPAQVLSEARSAFYHGELDRAQKLADGLLRDGKLSPQLFELMGHLRYRQGDLGRAALWYERASLFPPPVPELRQNIFHIRDRTGNVSFPSNGLRDQFSALLTRTDWLKFAIIGTWICLFGLVFYFLFVRYSALRTFFMLISVLAFTLAGIAALGWYWHPSFEKVHSLAFITTPDTKAYTAATVTSGSVMNLPPGSQVRRLEDRGAWAYVEIPTEGDTRRGWIQSDTMTAFWPFDAAYLE